MEENKKIEFETTKLVLDIYNKIMLWNNNDYDTNAQKVDALKIVSQDIIHSTLDGIMDGLNVKTGTEVSRGNIKVGDVRTAKDEQSFEKVDDKDIFNKLFNNPGSKLSDYL